MNKQTAATLKYISNLQEKIKKLERGEEPMVKQYRMERGFSQFHNSTEICKINMGETVELISSDEKSITVKMDNVQVVIELHDDTFEEWLSPIENKVITAEESWKDAEYSDMWDTEESKSAYLYGFRACEENKIKIYQEAVTLLEDWHRINLESDKTNYIPENFSIRVREALKNLKPIKDK